MFPRLRTIALLLVLGAVINCSVAMGFIWFGPAGTNDWEQFEFHGVHVARLESPGLTKLRWIPKDWAIEVHDASEPPAWSRLLRLPRPFMTLEEWTRLPEYREHEEIAAGWPWRCLVYEYDFPLGGPRVGEFAILSGMELPPKEEQGSWDGSIEHVRAVPLRIVPAGFVVNTVAFAGLAAGCWAALLATRCRLLAIGRAQRQRRRRCGMCGYSQAGLGEGTECPECGGGASPLADLQ